MKFLKNFDWSAKSIAKVIGVIFLGLFGLAVAVALVSFSFRTVFNPSTLPQFADGKGMSGGGFAVSAVSEESYYAEDMAMTNSRLSIMPPSPSPDFSTGDDAESYEVTTYSGSIETRKLDKTCDTIASLKSKDYVIFEDSNKNDDYCYYRFKVVKDKAEEIVKIIEDLDPETLNVNVQSIKARVEGVEDELDILKKKLASIEETLEDAQNAYDEISELATRQQDAETLAKIIDSKLNLIERLSNQRLQIRAQIDRYNEIKSSQLDRLNYTFFDINVYKNLLLDWDQIKDSWKFETQRLVRDVNEVIQSISLRLVSNLLRLAMGILYLFIAVFLLKFVWIGVKKIWKSGLKKRR